MHSVNKITGVLVIFIFSCLPSSFAQNVAEIQHEIRKSLNNFAMMLSYMNDEDEPVSIPTIAESFNTGKSTYFYYNDRSLPDMETMLENYNSKVLRRGEIEHEFSFSTNSISKVSNQDRRWKVKAELLRSPSDPRLDYKIKPVPVEFVVKWNGKGQNVTILEMKMPETLDIVRPSYRYKYDFSLTRHPNYVYAQGEECTVSVNSTRTKEKYYPGISGSEESVESSFVPFDIRGANEISEDNYISKTDGSAVKLKVPFNPKKESRAFSYVLTQEQSGKTLGMNFSQAGNANIRNSSIIGGPTNYISVGYGLKYSTFRVAYMNRPGRTRWTFGLSLAFNRDLFTNWSSRKLPAASEIEMWDENGYTVTQRTLNPADGFSPVFDPDGTAEKRDAYFDIMLLGGYNITYWLKIGLGAGIASHRLMHRIKDGYVVRETSYKKLQSDLPDLPTTYEYYPYPYGSMTFEKEETGAVFRPSLEFEIPLRKEYGHIRRALTLNVGYLIYAGIKNTNSFEISLGYAF